MKTREIDDDDTSDIKFALPLEGGKGDNERLKNSILIIIYHLRDLIKI